MVVNWSTSFGWGKGRKITSAEWQVTLCDPIWHVISRSGEAISTSNCYVYVLYLLYWFESVKLLHIGLVQYWNGSPSK